MRLASEALVLLVRLYQWTLRPFIGPQCRFEPSCSHYAIEALRRHGPLHGTALAAGRVLRCNPWNAGGWDPCPCHAPKFHLSARRADQNFRPSARRADQKFQPSARRADRQTDPI